MSSANTHSLASAIEDRHWRELVEQSGISPEIVDGRGYFTARREEEAAVLGFSEHQRKLTPALAIPMYSPVGELVTCQIKPDAPRKGKKGKPIKYETPEGSKVRLDVHPSQNGRLKDSSAALWITEGVKKADSLASRGEAAIALQGVWCWQRDGVPLPDWEEVRLHGREVYAAFDSDVTTNPKVQAALERLVKFLESRGAKAKVVYLPDAEDGSKVGVDDYLVAAGGTMEGLRNLAKEDLPQVGPGTYNLTDLGNAERFARSHRQDTRYCHELGRWLVWDGRRWSFDRTGAVERMAKQTVRSIYQEAEEAEDGDERRELAKHAIRSESQSRIGAMIDLARSEPEMPVTTDQLDKDRWLLNVENGTLDLKTGTLREHRREDLMTKLAPVEFDPEAEAPLFEAFLKRVVPSEAVRGFVQRLIGHSLTGDVSEQMLPFLYGSGANGKSTLISTILAMLGDYGQQTAPELLTVKGSTHPTELADLLGARLVASVEVDDGKRLAENLVKQLTGGDLIKARFMRQDFFEFEPTHKILFAANHKPEVRGTDHAIWRRIKLIPFEVKILEREKDPKLPEKLRRELPGILAWAVRGCLDWQQNGLGEPDEVRHATETYRAEEDVLAHFLQDKCVQQDRAVAKATVLYNAYQEWCEENGEKAETQTKFGKRLGERGFEKGRDPEDRRTTWRGIGLLTEERSGEH